MKFNRTTEEAALIDRIVDRAARMKLLAPIRTAAENLAISITAVHCNGCPIDLERLLAADDHNFMHDVCGIDANVSRKNGQLLNHFLPRCAKSDLPKVA